MGIFSIGDYDVITSYPRSEWEYTPWYYRPWVKGRFFRFETEERMIRGTDNDGFEKVTLMRGCNDFEHRDPKRPILVSEWMRTPFWLRLIGKTAKRRFIHVYVDYSDSVHEWWEYI